MEEKHQRGQKIDTWNGLTVKAETAGEGFMTELLAKD